MWSSPGTSRSKRAHFLRAALPCLALTALGSAPAGAQSLTPDLFSPNRGGFASPDTLPTRRTAGVPQAPLDALPALPDPNADLRKRQQAPARAGQNPTSQNPTNKVPTYGLPAANGASASGYDSLNRKRLQPKLYPGQPKPKRPVGPGSPVPPANAGSNARAAAHRAATLRDRAQDAGATGAGRQRARPAAAPPPQARRGFVRRGRRLCRQLPDQGWARALRRLRHQSGAFEQAGRLAGLCRRARPSRGVRLGAPRAGRRFARLVLRLHQQHAGDDRRLCLALAGRG
ncbi:hypothetical protein ACVWWG_004027 [Bradyrhizobium sp. LB7.2]